MTMSADNWRICPKCDKQDIDDAELEKKAAKKAYGNVPEDEYLAMWARATHRSPITAENLREDWQIGIDDKGTFSVEYRASCDVCGFSFEHKFEKKLKL